MEYTQRRQVTVGSSEITVGRFTYGHENLRILHWGEGATLTIGAFCSIASGTVYLGGNHRVDWITTYPFGVPPSGDLFDFVIKDPPLTNGNVVIGNDVWMGGEATIMSGVSVGDGAVIAANAHVVRDVGPYEIVGGNPATLIRRRFSDPIIERLLRLQWWDLPFGTIRGIGRELCAPPTIEKLDDFIRRFRPGQGVS